MSRFGEEVEGGGGAGMRAVSYGSWREPQLGPAAARFGSLGRLAIRANRMERRQMLVVALMYEFIRDKRLGRTELLGREEAL